MHALMPPAIAIAAIIAIRQGTPQKAIFTLMIAAAAYAAAAIISGY